MSTLTQSEMTGQHGYFLITVTNECGQILSTMWMEEMPNLVALSYAEVLMQRRLESPADVRSDK
jgi:hypothetical protein